MNNEFMESASDMDDAPETEPKQVYKMQETKLVGFSLSLRQDGCLVWDLEDMVDPDELVEALDEGTEDGYENAHDIAAAVRMVHSYYENIFEHVEAYLKDG
jgi:hypothetical protein